MLLPVCNVNVNHYHRYEVGTLTHSPNFVVRWCYAQYRHCSTCILCKICLFTWAANYVLSITNLFWWSSYYVCRIREKWATKKILKNFCCFIIILIEFHTTRLGGSMSATICMHFHVKCESRTNNSNLHIFDSIQVFPAFHALLRIGLLKLFSLSFDDFIIMIWNKHMYMHNAYIILISTRIIYIQQRQKTYWAVSEDSFIHIKRAYEL